VLVEAEAAERLQLQAGRPQVFDHLVKLAVIWVKLTDI
jgi:hypothetical protein